MKKVCWVLHQVHCMSANWESENQPGWIGFCLGWRMKGGLGGWQGVRWGASRRPMESQGRGHCVGHSDHRPGEMGVAHLSPWNQGSTAFNSNFCFTHSPSQHYCSHLLIPANVGNNLCPLWLCNDWTNLRRCRLWGFLGCCGRLGESALAVGGMARPLAVSSLSLESAQILSSLSFGTNDELPHSF